MDETKPERIARLKRHIRDLDEAIGSGVRSVFSDGERTEYQSIDDMKAARDGFKAELAVEVGSGRSPWRSFNVRPTMRW